MDDGSKASVSSSSAQAMQPEAFNEFKQKFYESLKNAGILERLKVYRRSPLYTS